MVGWAKFQKGMHAKRGRGSNIKVGSDPMPTMVIVRNKNDSMKMFFKCWISIFDAPYYISWNNGGEFICDCFYKMCEKLACNSS